MGFLKKIVQALIGKPYMQGYSVGPNNLAELLEQFDKPAIQKTSEDAIRDFKTRIAMANLEMEMLKLEPSVVYRGCQRWQDAQGNKYFDFVPCIVRPEVVYCATSRD